MIARGHHEWIWVPEISVVRRIVVVWVQSSNSKHLILLVVNNVDRCIYSCLVLTDILSIVERGILRSIAVKVLSPRWVHGEIVLLGWLGRLETHVESFSFVLLLVLAIRWLIIVNLFDFVNKLICRYFGDSAKIIAQFNLILRLLTSIFYKLMLVMTWLSCIEGDLGFHL